MSKFKITCVAPSYNHEKFVGFFIESVLNQTEQNFELIIVDDGSQDKNVDAILKFKDKRIKLIRHEYNKGIGQALNTAFKFARGKYIVFAGTDDIFESVHFETVSRYLDTNPNVGAYYCSCSLIDNKNNKIEDPNNMYVRKDINRFDILNTIFFLGNNLLDPGKAIRYKIVKKQIPFSASLLSLSDVQSHVKVALNSDIYTSDQRLVKYRLSGVSNTNTYFFKREQLEIDLLMNSFLQIKNVQLLEKIFEPEIKQSGLIPFKDTIPYFLGRMALLSVNNARKEWGYRTILNFLNNEKNSLIVYKKYNQSYKDIHNLIELLYYIKNEILPWYSLKRMLNFVFVKEKTGKLRKIKVFGHAMFTYRKK
ncbi:MAG: glycosyltransferase family 2 protein [Endomicrobium sp.]|jgi:glycosyltransferase involved in cell wall biosynthesis|nr:glycosyltransferase family 2 protein [Endomicrobium sp.]